MRYVGVLSGGRLCQVDFTRRQRRRPQNGRIRLAAKPSTSFLPLRYIREQAAPDAHIAYDAPAPIPPRRKPPHPLQLAIGLRHPMDVRRPGLRDP